MLMKGIAIAILLLFVALPSIGRTREQSTSTYTKDQVDARINELQSDMKQLIDRIDRIERLDEQRALSVKQSIDTLQSEIKLVERTKAPNYYSLVGPVLEGLLSSMIGGLVLWWIASHYTLGLKKFESTLEFSKRFGELIQEQSDLNQAYMKARTVENNPANDLETDQARVWWWRFFDLVLYEYDFFKRGLVWVERLTRWMKWSWHHWHEVDDQGKSVWKTNGIDYREGWKSWKEHPANKNSGLRKFLDAVHKLDDPDKVEGIVSANSPKPWRKYRLDE